MKILFVYNTMEYVWLRRRLIAALQDRGHAVVAMGPFDGWEDRVRALGVECVPIRMSRRGMNPLREAATVVALALAFRKVKPDRTILFTIKPIIYGAIAARLAGLERVFAMITGLGYMFSIGGIKGGFRQRMARTLYAAALRGLERVFFQNQDDYEIFRRFNIVRRDQAVRIAGSGVDTGWFRPPDEPPNERSIILVSRMLWEKGIGQYVEAARALRRRHPDLTFGVVGAPDDNPGGVPVATLAQWHQEGIIDYHGYVEDIRPLLGRALVYVLPSYYREGIPRTNLEALAMGKAIITTDMPGCRETVEDGVNGILVPPRDAKALEAAMARLIADPALARRMGRASRALAEQRFEQGAVNKILIDVLERTEAAHGARVAPGYGPVRQD